MERKILLAIGICILLTTSFFSGCVNIPKELTQFSIMSFDVEPSIVNQGEYANLSWVVLSASSVTIDNGIGNVALTGHRMIQPTQTTTYTLTASNATMTKNATAIVTVKPDSTVQDDVTITDSIKDVSSVDYYTGDTTVVTSHPEININNLDITKITYTKEGKLVRLTLQVRGNIENRGSIIDSYSEDIIDSHNFVEYDFQLTTSKGEYMVSYSNRSGQINNGLETINLASSDFSVAGDTLTIRFSLINVNEVYEELSVTSMFMKVNYVEGDLDPSGLVYLSDICPNPALKIIDASAPSSSYVGVSVQFNGSVSPLTGQPPYSYYWNFGDGESSTLLNPTHIYTKVGSYTYTFTVTDHSGDTARESGIITIII